MARIEGQSFEWTKACEESFQQLKDALVSAPVLAYPRTTEPFLLDTDASNVSVRAVLSQVHDGEEKVVAYYSHALSRPERNYCTTRRELLAVVRAIENFHPYLYGRPFTVRTDHASLLGVLTFKNPEGQTARWLEKLQTYDFRIKYRAGKGHQNADVLSQRPCFEANCTHCQRQEEKELSGDSKGSRPAYTFPVVRELHCKSAITGQEEPKEEELLGSQQWTMLRLRTSQMADRSISHIVKQKDSGHHPEWPAIAHLDSTTKAYWAQWDSLALREGVLYHQWESPERGEETWQLVLPRALRAGVLKLLHDSPVGGHLGVSKTLGIVRARFYWNHCRRDVEEWCHKCDRCAFRKGPRVEMRSPLQLYNVGEPLERVAIDVLGPLPETDSGNKYILIAMDYFSKWPKAYALPNQEAVTVANVLVAQFFSRFEVPAELHSDQGRNVESLVFREVCTLLGIHNTRTTALHPKSDGMVERYNRTLENQLATFVQDHQKDWDLHLPQLLMSYRSAVYETTKLTPAMLMFWRELRVPLDLLLGRPHADIEELSYLEREVASMNSDCS